MGLMIAAMVGEVRTATRSLSGACVTRLPKRRRAARPIHSICISLRSARYAIQALFDEVARLSESTSVTQLVRSLSFRGARSNACARPH